MKRRYLFIVVVSLILGCQEIDRFPLDQLSEGTFWANQQQAVQAINGVYNVLAHDQMYRSFFLQTDGLSANALSAFVFSGYLEISENIGWDARSSVPANFWGKSYEGVVRANQVITNVPNIAMDEGLKNRILGEAHFLRALFYFHLTNLWGDVPLIVEIQNVGEEAMVSRNPKAQVVSQVLADLEFSIANLPTRSQYPSSETGRVSKEAAHALKSRVHLYQKEWANVISEVNAVTQLGYGLVPMNEWPNQFLPQGNNNTTESIFEVQFLGFTGSNTGSAFNSIGLPNAPGFGGMGLYPTQNLANTFEEGDPRKNWTIIFPGEQFAGFLFNPELLDLNFGVTNLLRKKSVIPEPNIGGEGSQNAVVIRYAEMLLNLAEAENELNGPAAAAPHVNRIRNRVGLADLPHGLNTEEMREAIRKERRLELAFEGHQYFDLLRYGSEAMRDAMEMAIDGIAGHVRVFEPRVMSWPLPQREVDVNPNLLPQNPGW